MLTRKGVRIGEYRQEGGGGEGGGGEGGGVEGGGGERWGEVG